MVAKCDDTVLATFVEVERKHFFEIQHLALVINTAAAMFVLLLCCRQADTFIQNLAVCSWAAALFRGCILLKPNAS